MGEYVNAEDLPWVNLESTWFIPDVVISTRHHIPIDVVLFRLKKSIKKGTAIPACFWAAEMDISGWTELLWDELLDIAFSDVGLVSPLAPSHVFDFYNKWKNEDPLSVIAKRTLLTVVHYLCGVWKNRMVSHATIWSITNEQSGLLTVEEWRTSLGIRDSVKEELEIIQQGHTPSMIKTIDNMLLSLVRNNERACVKYGDYLVITGNTNVVWELILVCIKYTHECITEDFYTWFIPYMKKYKQICERYNRQCEEDKYLLGGHLQISENIYPKDKGFFKFEDGSYSYPYHEHPFSEKYEKYSRYMPYGKGFTPTNARRLNYVRRCIAQTVTLMCRGHPTGVDPRTPFDHCCEDFFTNDIYSEVYPTPYERPEDNVGNVPTDWTTRESSKFSTCDARHWWCMADDLGNPMNIQNTYSDPAFEKMLEQESCFGKRSSEEFILYRFIHSLQFYEGIVQPKPEMKVKKMFDTSHIEKSYESEEGDEANSLSQLYKELDSYMDDEKTVVLPSSDQIADIRKEMRNKDISVLKKGNDLEDLMFSFREKKSRMEEESVQEEEVPAREVDIEDKKFFTINVPLDKNIYCAINAISTTKCLLQPEECYEYILTCVVRGRKIEKKLMICDIIAISAQNGSSESSCIKTIGKSLAKPSIFLNNCSESIRGESLEKTLLIELIFSLLFRETRGTFPASIETLLDNSPGFCCQEVFGVVGNSQCFWNFLDNFRMKDTMCNCSKNEKEIWITQVKKLYEKHHKFLIEVIVRWNKRLNYNNADNEKIYKIDDTVSKTTGLVSEKTFCNRVKRMYTSIMGNRAYAAPARNKSPTALEIIFCS